MTAAREDSVEELKRRFGQAVAARRNQLGLSQEQFAAKICIDRTYVSKIERGQAFPSRPVARSIAEFAPSGADEFMALWADVEHRRRHLAANLRDRPLESVASDFVAFVGDEIARDTVGLVYPVFQLADEAQQALSHLNPHLLYTKEHTPFTRAHRIDVPLAASANDMRALFYVAEWLQRYISIRTTICTDTDIIRDCDCSFFAFGLGSNDCTHMYLETSERPLFDIVPDERDSEYLKLIDGSEFHSSEKENYGIILRARPNRIDHPHRVWFICAGRGPYATPGAAWYLASHWQDLHKRAGDSDFVEVIRTQSYSEKSTEHVHFIVDGG